MKSANGGWPASANLRQRREEKPPRQYAPRNNASAAPRLHTPRNGTTAPRLHAPRNGTTASARSHPAMPQLQPNAVRIALCVIGELRSLPMPSVFKSIRAVAKAWRADVFLCMKRDKHTGCIAALENLGRKLGAVLMHELPPWDQGCGSTASIQVWQNALCFQRAEQYSLAHGHVYNIFVRTRPDYIFLEPLLPLPTPQTEPLSLLQRGGVYGSRIYAVRPKADMAFVLTRTQMQAWVNDFPAACLPSHLCCLEYYHPSFKYPLHWTQDGAIVRHSGRLAFRNTPPRAGESRPAVQSSVLKRLKCNVSHDARHTAKATGHVETPSASGLSLLRRAWMLLDILRRPRFVLSMLHRWCEQRGSCEKVSDV